MTMNWSTGHSGCSEPLDLRGNCRLQNIKPLSPISVGTSSIVSPFKNHGGKPYGRALIKNRTRMCLGAVSLSPVEFVFCPTVLVIPVILPPVVVKVLLAVTPVTVEEVAVFKSFTDPTYVTPFSPSPSGIIPVYPDQPALAPSLTHVREFQYCCPAATPLTLCPPTDTFCALAVPETV